MAMVSKNGGGVPAPQLREAQLSPQRLRHAFLHVAMSMRAMYQRAKLVHGDLSEFNILYVGSKLQPIVFIDVGQATDLSHPKQMDYLRRDCRTVLDFFTRKCNKLNVSFGLPAMEELVQYVVMEVQEELVEGLTCEQIDQLSIKRMKRMLKGT